MYQRTSKDSHLDTVWYEMDMLEFSYREFTNNRRPPQGPEWNLLIEGFLLHYRNLIQFFAGSEQRHRRYKGNDLSTFDPILWAGRVLTVDEIAGIKDPGTILDDMYSNKISNLLQHCTIRRVDPLQGWEMDTMYSEIQPIMGAFARAFPRETRVCTRSESTSTSTETVIVYKNTLGFINDADS